MISLPSGPEVHAYSDGPAVHQQVSLSLSLNFFGGVFLGGTRKPPGQWCLSVGR